MKEKHEEHVTRMRVEHENRTKKEHAKNGTTPKDPTWGPIRDLGSTLVGIATLSSVNDLKERRGRRAKLAVGEKTDGQGLYLDACPAPPTR